MKARKLVWTLRLLITTLLFNGSPQPCPAEEPMPAVVLDPGAPPILTLTRYSRTTGAILTVAGQPESELLIEHSPDLQLWLPVAPATLNSEGVGRIADVSAATESMRLYRAKSTMGPLVYSANAVGFVNLTLGPGWQLIANPLISSNNTVPALFSSAPNGVSVLKWDPAQQRFISHDRLGNWPDQDVTLLPGEGCFFHNPFGTNMVQTFVGDVSNHLVPPMLPHGFSLQSVPKPYHGPIPAPYGLLPPARRIPPADRDGIFLWSLNARAYLEYTFLEGLGWIALPEGDVQDPQVNVAESFFYYNPGPPRWPIFDPGPLTIWLADSPNAATAFVNTPSPNNGAVNLFTFNTDPAYGRVFDADGFTPLSSGYKAQLYWGTTDSATDLSSAGIPIGFLSGSGAGYLRGGTIQIPAFPNTQLYFQLRVWAEAEGATYEEASASGGSTAQSPLFSLIPALNIIPPPFANSFRSFNLNGTLQPRLRFSQQPGTLVFSNGAFHAQLTGRSASSTVTIEASSDLRTWVEIPTGNQGADFIQIVDPAPPSARYRFYRAHEIPSNRAP